MKINIIDSIFNISIESMVVNQISKRVGDELEKSFNKEEDLGSYIKRTMHGKLAKKDVRG